MSSRIPSHQLRSGLYVSGRAQQPKDKPNPAAPRPVPYTGGDVNNSGELGKMFHIPSARPSSRLSGPPTPRPSSSGPLPLHPTGLIVSGPAGPMDRAGSVKTTHHGSAVTRLAEGSGFRVSKLVVWVVMAVVAVGVMVGAFLVVVVKKKMVSVVAVAAILVVAAVVVMVVVRSCGWGRSGVLGFVRRCEDAELRGAIDGQYVKVTGVVTCGSIPLETSYQRVPRCVYVSTELYEYKGLCGKSANPKHRCFSWGSRYSERYVADFYISDFQSGLRALVKAGYGAKVAPFVEPATVVEVTQKNKELSPSFLSWLAERDLSTDDRIMRLKEGYIKEGSTVSVMGVVRRHDNAVMIVPSAEPLSTGCLWVRCLLPTYVQGLILTCDDSQNTDVVPV